ncbi:conjugal transfer protein [Enterococcus sp. AZ109]|uniref:conjugal transfer protein n=1 Tax=Enterococcus sp. AZ109 TaxID=2774634 RepID=UPI003F2522F6
MKEKIKHVGLRKNTTIILWTLLIGSVFFGIYKNFTAIDQHTVHEEKVIEMKLVDTNKIESFVQNFAQEFYTWEPNQEQLDARMERLKNYLPENLQQMNQEMIRSDIPTKSTVNKVQIWEVGAINESYYKVLYSVNQVIEESIGEEVERRGVESAFSVTVRINKQNQLVLLTNPVMASLPSKLEVKNDPLQDDSTITQETKEEIKTFLTTFFTAYPSASETELLYYVEDTTIQGINENYIFSELRAINYFEDNEGVKVKTAVSYLSPDTKATLVFDYELVLKKNQKNWVILDGI